MDEPTAALSPNEVENLFRDVRRLRERGVAIVFISHRLEEVSAIADTVTVLRDGRHVAHEAVDGAPARRDGPPDGRALAGRALPEGGRPRSAKSCSGRGAHPIRRVLRRLVRAPPRRDRRPGRLRRLRPHRDRARRSSASTRSTPESSASRDRRFRPSSPRAALRRGLAYLPEDRLHQGLVQPMSIAVNSSMAVLPRLTPAGILRPWRGAGARASLHGAAADQGDLACADRAQPVGWQPAEGRARQVAGGRAEDPDPRRADARRRRRHEGRRPSHDLAPAPRAG